MSASLLSDGYTELPGFIAGAALAEAQRLAEVDDEPLQSTCSRPHNTLSPVPWDHPVLDVVVDERARIEYAAGARDLRFISGYLSIKEGRSKALWWHQDWWCWQHPISLQREPAQVALLVYLCDTDERSGALRVLPGTHHRSIDVHAELAGAHADETTAADDAHPVMRDHPLQVTCAARAGDAVLVDYRLLHGTHPNEASHRRTCLIVNFAPAWSELPEEIRAHLIQHPSLPSGGVLAEARRHDWLPSFSGQPADLMLQRDAPAEFVAAGE
jgi:ectoine hydroxylase-related dioxygenase (phytanoyl-CoA dioxygenase family)